MTATRTVSVLVAIAAAGGLAVLIGLRLADELGGPASTDDRRNRAAPVEVAVAERSTIRDVRVFGGSLAAQAQFLVAPKVGGQVESLSVDIGDSVTRGMIVARLDDQEYRQAVAEAEAELEVARANRALAQSQRDLAERSSERVLELEERRIASGSAVDVAAADLAANRARVEVAAAEVSRAEAALAAARIRLGYTEVVATWPEDKNADGESRTRVVSRRYVDAGATVTANDSIVEVIDSSRLRAVFFATERDHARLAVGQAVTIATDAFPDKTFEGEVRRIAPLFEESSRQIRVEVDVDNADGLLKPGIYVRLQVVMRTEEQALVVPFSAIVRRDGGDGLFVVLGEGDTTTARWLPVDLGVRERERVAVAAAANTDNHPPLTAGSRVVTLGQQLLEEGARVRVRSPSDNSVTNTKGAPGRVVVDGPGAGG